MGEHKGCFRGRLHLNFLLLFGRPGDAPAADSREEGLELIRVHGTFEYGQISL